MAPKSVEAASNLPLTLILLPFFAEKTRQTVTAWSGMSSLQGGDPAKLARALIELVSQDEPPLRWAAGADTMVDLERKAQLLLAQADAYRELSSSLAHDDA